MSVLKKFIEKLLFKDTTVQDSIKVMNYHKKYNLIKDKKLMIFAKLFLMRKYKRICLKYNSYIPLKSRLGENIFFPHGLCGIFISQGAKIGDNCTIFQQVTIGSNTLSDSKGCGSPIIGRNVYIGAGAKIIGNVKIGDNVRIGANAVVVEDVPDNATVVMQSQRVITHDDSRKNTFSFY